MNLASNKNPVKITDLSFRDGHQSLLATRVRTKDLEAIAPEMDKVGFWSMEVWGGATFDVMTRFLNEDPWERIRILKRAMPHTKLQMLLRGQNLVAYRNYADDVVIAFVHHAADCGLLIITWNRYQRFHCYLFSFYPADIRPIILPIHAISTCNKWDAYSSYHTYESYL